MRNTEIKYSKILLKALLRKLRPQRILLYALAGMMMIYDLIGLKSEYAYTVLQEASNFDYTMILLGVSLLFIGFNIMGTDLFSNLQFIPQTKRTRHRVLFVSQFILLFIGQILGLCCYLFQCAVQNIITAIPNQTYVYRIIGVEASVIGKGFLFYMLLGITAIITLMLVRYLMCHYNKFLIGIYVLVGLNMIMLVDTYDRRNLLLFVLGNFILGGQAYWSMIIKLLVVMVILAGVLLVLVRKKTKYKRRVKSLYVLELGALAICVMTLFMGSIYDNYVDYKGETSYTKDEGDHETSKTLDLGDASLYGDKLNIELSGIASETRVFAKKYKQNKEGDNSITVLMQQTATVGKKGMCDLSDVRLVKEKAKEGSIHVKMDFNEITYTSIEPYYGLNRYLQGKYSLIHTGMQSSSRIIILYPDTIEIGKTHIYQDDESCNFSYQDYDEFIGK